MNSSREILCKLNEAISKFGDRKIKKIYLNNGGFIILNLNHSEKFKNGNFKTIGCDVLGTINSSRCANKYYVGDMDGYTANEYLLPFSTVENMILDNEGIDTRRTFPE